MRCRGAETSVQPSALPFSPLLSYMGVPDLSAGPQQLSLKFGFSPQFPHLHAAALPPPRDRSAGLGASGAGLNGTSPLHSTAWVPWSSILTLIAAGSWDRGTFV